MTQYNLRGPVPFNYSKKIEPETGSQVPGVSGGNSGRSAYQGTATTGTRFPAGSGVRIQWQERNEFLLLLVLGNPAATRETILQTQGATTGNNERSSSSRILRNSHLCSSRSTTTTTSTTANFYTGVHSPGYPGTRYPGTCWKHLVRNNRRRNGCTSPRTHHRIGCLPLLFGAFSDLKVVIVTEKPTFLDKLALLVGR
eukprot:2439808-Rhodomonas_salina.1